MRAVLSRSSWLIVGLTVMFVASGAEAQEATETGRSHTVKRGDTLWDLAHTYLGNPFLWPEIYRINTDVVEDPHWIYPGEVLRVPGQQVAEAPPPALTDEPEMVDAPPVTQVATQPQPGQATVFANSPFSRRPSAPSRQVVAADVAEAVSPGEYYAAPWVDRSGGPAGAGQIVAPVDIPGVTQMREATWLHQHDRLYLTVPAGAIAGVGDHYLTYRLGPSLSGGQQVVVPTGVVRIVATHPTDASTGRLVQQFDVVRVGDRLIPLERVALPLRTTLLPAEFGVEGQVIWIPRDVVLPSLQHYVLLDVTTRDGVRLGDLFTLYRGRRSVDGVTLPEEDVALIQIVRVTDRAATGLVLDQRHPAIQQGMPARLTRRMP